VCEAGITAGKRVFAKTASDVDNAGLNCCCVTLELGSFTFVEVSEGSAAHKR
jgi:hypothetical protein